MAIQFTKPSANLDGAGGGLHVKGYYLVSCEASPSMTDNPEWSHQIALKLSVVEGVTEDGRELGDDVEKMWRNWLQCPDPDKMSEGQYTTTQDILARAIQAANPTDDVAAALSGLSFSSDEEAVETLAAMLDGKTFPVHIEPRDLNAPKDYKTNADRFDYLSMDKYKAALDGSFRINARNVKSQDMGAASTSTPSNGIKVPPKPTGKVGGNAASSVASILGGGRA